MGFFSWFGGAAAPPESVFQIANGKVLTPFDLGQSALRWASDHAREMLARLFPDAQPRLAGHGAVTQAPFAAHLYLTTLYAGAQLAYVRDILRADATTLGSFVDGLREAIGAMRTSGSAAPPPAEQDSIYRTIELFATCASEDANVAAATDPRKIHPVGAMGNCTAQLCDMVDRAYAARGVDHRGCVFGDIVYVQHMAKLHALDSAVSDLQLQLRDQLGLRLVDGGAQRDAR